MLVFIRPSYFPFSSFEAAEYNYEPQVVLEGPRAKEGPKLECPPTPTPSVEDIEKRLKVEKL